MLLNRDRATTFMRDCGLDAIIATSPLNVTYLSDFHCWIAALFREYMVTPGASSRLVQQNLAVVPAGDAHPVLVVEPFLAADAKESWIADVRIAGGGDFEDQGGAGSVPPSLLDTLGLIRGGGSDSPVSALAAALSERGLADGRLGVELDGLAPVISMELHDRLPRAELRDCSNLLRLTRAVKSAEEIDRLERAATAAELAAHDAFATAAPRRTLWELEQVYRAKLGELGVDFDHFVFGPRGIGIVSHAAYALVEGDVLYADWGCLHAGYGSDTGTTLMIGDPPGDLEARFEATVAAVEAGAALAHPGVLASEVQAAMRDAMHDAGITHCFPHGHGFGLEVRDYPIITPPTGLPIRDDCIEVSSDLPLEEGMVFNLEAPVFVLGRGSVHTERSFVVTADGCRALVRQDRATPAHGADNANEGGNLVL
jgi:Xaa-Pro aminopeptidase